ncbi:MAG: glycine betaine ABC transporter substrate-binding protein, partial [Brachybacterium sp.]|nr:glycine betaine ABC transporter substrate-binding protein [Brachybacterium sp.]
MTPQRTSTVQRRHVLGIAGAGAIALGAAACGGDSDPLAEDDGGNGADGGGASGAIVIGSQQYYSNEIIAEIYAQVLESHGAEVDRQFQIGQREVYIPELQNGTIDLMPEYLGNLLQYLDSEADVEDA